MGGILRFFKNSLTALWTLINIFCVAMMLLAAYGGYVAPSRLAMLQVLNMTFPGWVVLSIILLVINVFVIRRLAWMWLAAMAAAMPAIWLFCPLNIIKPKVDKGVQTFTVLTYNVMNFVDNQSIYPDNGNRTIGYILSTDADIVCLQEWSTNASKRPVGATQSQMDSIAHRYPYRLTRTHTGESLLSKYPFKKLPTPHSPWISGDYEAYVVDIEGRELTVINCHLRSIGLSDDDKQLYHEITENEIRTKSELRKVKNDLISKLTAAFRERAEQADSLKTLINRCGENVVLVGDFNDIAGSYAYRTVRSAGMDDAYTQCAFGPTITFSNNRFYFHIDQVFYKGNLKAIDIKRGNLRCSDHYPLLTTFAWQNKYK